MRTIALLTCVLACWRGPQPHRARHTIPTPYVERDLEFALSPGNQTELRQTLCAGTFVGKDRWRAVLEQRGYIVEVSRWVMGHPGSRETYALRFRRPPIFGDVVARPGRADNCNEYIIRVQHSQDALRPDPWRSEHGLAKMFESINRFRTEQPERVFDSTQDHLYPSGYP